MIKDKDVKYVDLRFTDPRGKMQHVTMDVVADRRGLRSPTASCSTAPRSPAGRRSTKSDMMLMPDPDTAHIDPFFAQTTLAMFCDMLEPGDRRALRARPALDRQEGRGLPEADRHRRHGLCRPGSRVLHLRRRALHQPSPTTPASSSTSIELPTNAGTEYEMGNLGHRPRTKGGYFPVPPMDQRQDMRSEMLSVMARDGRRRSRSTTTRWPPPSTSSA